MNIDRSLTGQRQYIFRDYIAKGDDDQKVRLVLRDLIAKRCCFNRSRLQNTISQVQCSYLDCRWRHLAAPSFGAVRCCDHHADIIIVFMQRNERRDGKLRCPHKYDFKSFIHFSRSCFLTRRLYICLFNALMCSMNNVPFKWSISC